ncbi:MAG: hypothetical protein EB127_21815 [Alphaproteobacteria bacterium]|nr:hypothetical protein [Alphaproteobacteria bacterium]
MDAQELRNLQEAYREVDENGFIRSRIDRNLNKIERKKSTLRKSSQNPSFFGPTTSKRNVLSGQLSKSKRNLNKEQVDLYDIILSHLLDEGYAETPKAAEAIMVNMSEEWRESIIG